MTMPLPALLALIVLLLWPMGRLVAVLARPVRLALLAPPRRVRFVWSWQTALSIAGPVLIHSVLLLIVVAALWCVSALYVRWLGGTVILFGLVSLTQLVNMFVILQFSAAVFLAAINTYRALHDVEVTNSKVAALDLADVLRRVRMAAKLDIPVYLSAPLFSFAILLIVVGMNGAGDFGPSLIAR